jgi:hypothetical protein
VPGTEIENRKQKKYRKQKQRVHVPRFRGRRGSDVNIRRKLAVIAAITLPLAGVAVAGGIQAASAGGGPLLTCPFVDSSVSQLVFDGGGGPGSAGIFLTSNPGGTYALAANAVGNATSIETTNLAIAGETLNIGTDPTTYTVTNDTAATAPYYNPTTLDITPALPPGTKGIADKVKTAVVVHPTTDFSGILPGNTSVSVTEAYNPAVTEDMTLHLTGCTSSAVIPGDFAPNNATFNATAPASNAATQLEGSAVHLVANPSPPPAAYPVGTPANVSGTVSYPTDPDYGPAPQSTTLNFITPKSDSVNLTNFNIAYGSGAASAGDFQTAKSGHLALNALVSMTVCSYGELQAIENSGVAGGPDSTANGGLIAFGASPLVVCDGGTSSAYGGNGLDEILSAETGGTPVAADGTPPAAIYQISLTTSGNNVV